MEIFSGLISGFSIALTPINLLFAFLGALVGTAIGVLPGLGPAATIALLLPAIYVIDAPVTAIILMAGIFYGSMYGGSTTSILLNLPGEAASVVTCIDGYQMALKGRAGAALGIAAIGSFVAGTVGHPGNDPVRADDRGIRPEFRPPGEVLPCRRRPAHGGDPFGGFRRQRARDAGDGSPAGLGGARSHLRKNEVLLRRHRAAERIRFRDPRHGGVRVGRDLLRARIRHQDRNRHHQGRPGVAHHEGLGGIADGDPPRHPDRILHRRHPGGGAVISSLVSYAVEKRVSKHPEEFGRGAIEGVAGPESANNAASSSSFIPLLTLGIPGNASIAMIFAALLIKGITPGPFLIVEHPDVFWGVIASMYIGNVMLLVLNLPLVGLWAQLLRVPFGIMAPVIILFTAIGSYSIQGQAFDIYSLVGFGLFGYLLRKLKFEPGAMVLAFVLGPMVEGSMRQSLLMSGGSFSIFVTRPISLALIGLFAVLAISQSVVTLRKRFRTTT